MDLNIGDSFSSFAALSGSIWNVLGRGQGPKQSFGFAGIAMPEVNSLKDNKENWILETIIKTNMNKYWF